MLLTNSAETNCPLFVSPTRVSVYLYPILQDYANAQKTDSSGISINFLFPILESLYWSLGSRGS